MGGRVGQGNFAATVVHGELRVEAHAVHHMLWQAQQTPGLSTDKSADAPREVARMPRGIVYSGVAVTKSPLGAVNRGGAGKLLTELGHAPYLQIAKVQQLSPLSLQ